MKKSKLFEGWGWTFIVAVLFSSCGAHYSNDIGQRMTAQQCKSLPVNDSVAALYTAGYISIAYNRDAPGSNPEICDSIYIVSKTWWQAWQAGKKDGSVIIFFLGIAGAILSLYALFRAFANNRDSNSKAPLGWLVPLFGCLVIAGCALSWDKWNTDREIRKQDYVNEVQTKGDLHSFWETPAKNY